MTPEISLSENIYYFFRLSNIFQISTLAISKRLLFTYLCRIKCDSFVTSNLFRLKPTNTIKYFAIHKPNFKSENRDPVEYRAVEHAHWFYTADSNGRKHDFLAIHPPEAVKSLYIYFYLT